MRSSEWREGYMAYENGMRHFDNPYHPDTVANDEWITGWLAAQKWEEK